MRKKQSKQFPLLIKVFIQSILVFNIIMYEMQEDGQSPADVLGERKISFKTLGNLFDVKEHWIRLLETIPKGKTKGKSIFSSFIMCLTRDS